MTRVFSQHGILEYSFLVDVEIYVILFILTVTDCGNLTDPVNMWGLVTLVLSQHGILSNDF